MIQILLYKSKSGQSLIELLVAMTLAAILIPALLMSLILPREGREQQVQRLKAVSLVKEAMETVRSIRESDWTSFAINGIFHPEASASSWKLVNGSEMIDGFDRRIVIDNIYRSSSGNIATSGGTLDPSTKKVTATVAWGFPFFSEVSSTIYLTRHKYKSYKETTFDEFKNGTKDGVTITKVDDGEVILGAGGASDWCEPNLSIQALDLPGQGITTAISATTSATMDYAYTTTGGNSSGNSMDSIDIDRSEPPIATNAGSYNNRKTYGIYVDNPNHYVYLTSDHPNLTVDIVQVSSKPYTQTGTFEASEGGAGTSVFVAYNLAHGHDIGYVTAGNILYTFDLSGKTGPRTEIGHADLPGTGQKIIIVGDYAYIALDKDNEQLNIFNISNPEIPTFVSRINLGNNQPAKDIFVNQSGTRVYLVTKQQFPTNINNFFIINTSDKVSTLPLPIGVYNTGSMDPKGVALVPGNKAIIVGSGGEQYQVLRLDDPDEKTPKHCGGLTNPNGANAINAIASVLRNNHTAYSYILTDSSSKEFQIIEGGPGEISTLGVFESQTFDATSEAAFNKFDVTFSKPTSTNITFQIGIEHAINGSCNNVNFTFVGPDGTSNSYFSTGGAIPFDNDSIGFENPGRCLRYKTFLSSSDPSQTPVFYDITFNFSP